MVPDTLPRSTTAIHEAPTMPGATHRPARAPFAEHHRRLVDASLDTTWRAALDVSPGEIRWFAPLIAVRSLPARLRGRTGVADRTESASLLELFEHEGFVRLLDEAVGDVCRVEFGAIGRFWSLANNQPVRFNSADEFGRFDEPGFARIWFELRAEPATSGTLISTTTIVDGTDRTAERRFAPYWALIRLPSGLIRRSWLAAIERRAIR